MIVSQTQTSSSVLLICAISLSGYTLCFAPTFDEKSAINDFETNKIIYEGDHKLDTISTLNQKTAIAEKNTLVEDKTKKELLTYLNFEDDWDGYDGKPPAKDLVFKTIDFTDFLLKKGLMMPKSTVSGDGVIGLYWKTERFFAEIDFDADGLVGFFAEDRVNSLKLYSEDFSINAEGFEYTTQLEPFLTFLSKTAKNISSWS